MAQQVTDTAVNAHFALFGNKTSKVHVAQDHTVAQYLHVRPGMMRLLIVGTLLPNGYTKLSPLSRVNPKARVNPRLKASQVKPHSESPTYRAQLALQAFAATQSQLLQRTVQLANSIAMVSP